MYIDIDKITKLEMHLVNNNFTSNSINSTSLKLCEILNDMAVSINEITKYLDDINKIEIERLERE